MNNNGELNYCCIEGEMLEEEVFNLTYDNNDIREFIYNRTNYFVGESIIKVSLISHEIGMVRIAKENFIKIVSSMINEIIIIIDNALSEDFSELDETTVISSNNLFGLIQLYSEINNDNSECNDSEKLDISRSLINSYTYTLENDLNVCKLIDMNNELNEIKNLYNSDSKLTKTVKSIREELDFSNLKFNLNIFMVSILICKNIDRNKREQSLIDFIYDIKKVINED